MKTKKGKVVEEGKLASMMEVLANSLNVPRAQIENILVLNFPALKNKEHCANCGEKMWAYWYSVDRLNALTLMALGRELRTRLNEAKPFTEANRFKMTRMNTLTDAMRHRSTILSKLGLVAKVFGPDGRQDASQWLITTRGFAFLRGEPVPRKVKVWRNQIEERTDELITIEVALGADRGLYRREDFYEIAEHGGTLFPSRSTTSV